MKYAASVIWRLSLAGLLGSAAVAVARIPRAVHRELSATRSVVDSRIAREAQSLRAMVYNGMAEILGRLDAAIAIADLRSDAALGELAAARRSMLLLGLRATSDLNVRLAEANGALQEVARLRQDLAPAVAGANLLMRRDALPAQVLGTLGAAKITLGESAKTMREIQRATPELLATVDRIGSNIDRATMASAEASEHASATFANLERQTKPQHLWLRFAPEALRTAIIAIGFLR